MPWAFSRTSGHSLESEDPITPEFCVLVGTLLRKGTVPRTPETRHAWGGEAQKAQISELERPQGTLIEKPEVQRAHVAQPKLHSQLRKDPKGVLSWCEGL